jgi:hypothetical protein
VNLFKSNDDFDQIDLTCDILDATLISLSYILKTFSKEIQDVLEKSPNPLNIFLEELINFDLEQMMSYAT